MSEAQRVTVAMPGYNPLATPEAVEGYISTLSRRAALTDDQKAHIRERRSVTPSQYQDAANAKDRAISDAEFRRRFFSGDRAERSEWTGWQIVLGSRVEG
jgi:hypothetical protein